MLLQVPSNISPTSELKETKVGDLPNLSKRAELVHLAPRLTGVVDWVDVGSFFLGETLCEQRVVAMSFFLGFFISGVVL